MFEALLDEVARDRLVHLLEVDEGGDARSLASLRCHMGLGIGHYVPIHRLQMKSVLSGATRDFIVEQRRAGEKMRESTLMREIGR